MQAWIRDKDRFAHLQACIMHMVRSIVNLALVARLNMHNRPTSNSTYLSAHHFASEHYTGISHECSLCSHFARLPYEHKSRVDQCTLGFMLFVSPYPDVHFPCRSLPDSKYAKCAPE
jgi:hypothetical protein